MISSSPMTAGELMQALLELSSAHACQVREGKISEAHANDELQDLVMRGRRAMSDEEFRKVLDLILSAHGTIASELAEMGQPQPGNDPNKPN